MKLSLMSDLHLEFSKMVPLPGGDVLLLSGDIVPSAPLFGRTDKYSIRVQGFAKDLFFTECAKYQKVFYVMGNHEHYNGQFDTTASQLRTFLEGSNVELLDNQIADLGDIVLFGATLWTDLDNHNPIIEQVAKYGMNDYRLIANKTGSPLHPQDTIADHNATLADLENVYQLYSDRRIGVMTHHSPSLKSIHPKYGNDPLNACYSSDLSEFILNHPRIEFWTHGHTHTSFDYKVGNCRVIANTRGYAHNQKLEQSENPDFDVNFTFEV